MAVTSEELFEAAKKLYGYILKEHWTGQALTGPDSGIRINARIGRFIKSYLHFIPWSDKYTYMQSQGYWILNNWLMADLLHDHQCEEIAVNCAKYVLSVQQPEGFWHYPNPEWKSRIATVEGCFAALGFLESYAWVQHEPFLTGARLWYQYLLNEVGFQGSNGLLAINYFSNIPGAMVPNNTTLALWTISKLAEDTNNEKFLAPCTGMVAWLDHVQFENGELPYAVDSSAGEGRPHFLCYQYNAFEFLDLVHYYRITKDKAIWPVLGRLAKYLSTGLTESGAARFDCFHKTPEVTYYTSAIAHALSWATKLGLGDFKSIANQGFSRILNLQNADGGFKFFSRKNYGLLADRRSYPRNLSMILNHLLSEGALRASV